MQYTNANEVTKCGVCVPDIDYVRTIAYVHGDKERTLKAQVAGECVS